VSVSAAPAAAAGVRARHSPYQGLVPYAEADAEWFFGRDEWSEVIADNFRAYRVTVLYGVSGVGKSSLLHAGLMRRLGDEARGSVTAMGTPRLLPVAFSAWSRDDPVAALKEAVRERTEGIVPDLQSHSPNGTLAEVLEAWPALVGAPLLLVLDQLEELFAYHEHHPGDPTLEELTAALRRRDPAIHFLLSIREDALASLDRFEGHVSGLGEHLLRLEHLDRGAAREAIVEPLERWNRTVAAPGEEMAIEPPLIEAVLEQVASGKVNLGENGAAARDESTGVEAPYLQLVLARLWDEERQEGSRVLRMQTLERLGGADRIVRTHLDTALAALPERDQDIAGQTFRYLVTPSGTKIAHRTADLADYAQAPLERIDDVVDRLAGEARVLRPAGDGRYEIYHDALAGPIVDWRRRWEERQKHRRERRRFAILAGVAAALAAIAVVIAILAILAWHARHEARVGQSQALAGEAIASLDRDAPGALRLAVEAAETSPTSQAESALRRTLASFLLRKTLRGHVGSVRSAAFSSDGQLVVTGGEDGTARIWDRANGRLLRTLAGHDGPVTSADFSRDGKLVVTGSDDGTARIWDTESGSLRNTLRDHLVSVFDVAFSPRGDHVITASYDGAARIWDVDTGRLVRTLGRGHGPVFSAAFSPDGSLVATASGYDGNAWLWRADTGGPPVQVLGGHVSKVERVAFSPDGMLIVTAGDDGSAQVREVRTGRLVHVLSGHEGSVFAVAFNPDGTVIVTAGSDGSVRFWDTDSGRLLRILGSGGTVFDAAFSRDGELVTAGDEGRVRLWDTQREPSPRTLSTGRVSSAVFSPDGRRLITAGAAVGVWDAASGHRLRTLGGNFGPVAALSRDGHLALTVGGGTARIWDTGTGRLVHTLSRHRGLKTASFNPDGTRVVTAGSDGTASLWNTGTGRLVHRLTRHRGAVLATAFSPDGTRVLTAGADAAARLSDASSGSLLQTLRARAPLRSAGFSADGKLVVAASDDGTALLWNAGDGRLLQRMTGGQIRSAAFSPDGRLVVTASDDATARLWDTSSGRGLRILSGHGGAVRSAVFSPDGKLIVTASDDWTARLWDTDSGGPLSTLMGHEDAVNRAAFSPDGKLIVTTSEDGTARIWTCDVCGVGVHELLSRAKKRLDSSS
jgi:WD40 repeat protein